VVKILFFASNPVDTRPLVLDEEIRSMSDDQRRCNRSIDIVRRRKDTRGWLRARLRSLPPRGDQVPAQANQHLTFKPAALEEGFPFALVGRK
jgi:hypothetical protein